MRRTLKSTNVPLTAELRGYVEKKLEAIEKIVGEEPAAICEVEVGRPMKSRERGPLYYAEFTLRLPGRDLRATAERETLHAALDEVKDEILQELRKEKTKRMQFLRTQGARLKEFLRSLPARSVEQFGKLRGFPRFPKLPKFPKWRK